MEWVRYRRRLAALVVQDSYREKTGCQWLPEIPVACGPGRGNEEKEEKILQMRSRREMIHLRFVLRGG